MQIKIENVFKIKDNEKQNTVKIQNQLRIKLNMVKKKLKLK